ncbi:methionyl-tRNA formyltransferase [Buchnera aphidicola (Mindarus keteleerifoliae)]|uniref:methionyl-tRNA formyltransferase n=1 Tax=Buchnera aphidicola TaxID=9 RepID=UPI0031B675EC
MKKKTNSMNIIFSGTSEFSAMHLIALLNSGYKIVLVLTKPDSFSGRGKKLTFSPVKKIALKRSIPILQPNSLQEKKTFCTLRDYHADIMIVISYGYIFPKKIINLFKKGCINVHPSLLPRWRGATPIQSAILKGDKITGVSLIQINEKIDNGNILLSKSCIISKNETTYSLSKKLQFIGIKLLKKILKKIFFGTLIQKTQNNKYATYSKKINKKDALLKWNKSALKLERKIRAFNPWPITFFKFKETIIKVWKAKKINSTSVLPIGTILEVNSKGIQINTNKEILNIEKIQFPGKKVISVKDLINSNKNYFSKQNKIS